MQSNELPPVILDIETRGDKRLENLFMDNIKAPGNIKDPDKIAMAIRKKEQEATKEMAVDTDFNEIICIGIKVVDEEPQLMNLREFVDWYNTEVKVSETDIGRRTNGMRTMVTFNGKCFDLPTMIKGAIKEGLEDFPYQDFILMMDKYKSKGRYIDLMDDIGMVWGKNKSLDKYLQIYLGVAKKDIDFETAGVDEIKEHCLEDLLNSEKLFKKFKKLWYI
uniref:Putative DNA polymerase n=1 Tax=viral metagenome TaxID=1070528 RepID=A0A6H1ZS55_9ZZZZ